MSYTTHGFVSGMKLTGTAMAEMDAQIAANEAAIAAVAARVDLVSGQRMTALRTLSLTADSDTVYLYLGDELLSSVNLPDVTDRISCTGLSVSGTLTGLIVGDTAQITAVKQPNDCNQAVRYQSSDTSVAMVSSAGLVTAVGSGTATITVTCGSYSQTLTAKVSRVVGLAGNMDDCAWLQMNTYGSYAGALFTVDGSLAYIGTLPFDFDKFKVKNGETATLNILETGWKLKRLCIVAAASGKTPALVDMREDNDRYMIDGVEQAATVDTGTNGLTSYTYTNSTGEDCWIVFAVSRNTDTLEEALTNINSKISLVIGPE